jgi:hypothetical protein
MHWLDPCPGVARVPGARHELIKLRSWPPRPEPRPPAVQCRGSDCDSQQELEEDHGKSPREPRLDGGSVSFSFDEETHGVPLLRVGANVLPCPLLEPVCRDRVFGCMEDSAEPDGVQLRTAHDCSQRLHMGNVCVIGEGPGGTGPIGLSQRSPHAMASGPARDDIRTSQCAGRHRVEMTWSASRHEHT